MANLIPITAFMPLVLTFAPTVPEPVAEQMIRLAAVEFCERTRCWRYMFTRRIGGLEEEACPAPGPVRLFPPYATIFEFEFAYFNGAKLAPMQYSDIDILPDDSDPVSGPPTHITQAAPGQIALIPRPDASGSLNVSAFLKPVASDEWSGSTYDMQEDDDLNVLPDFLLTQHGEAIQFGALARILAIPGQAYTDPARSEFYRLAFAAKLDSGFQINLRGQQRTPPRSKPSNF